MSSTMRGSVTSIGSRVTFAQEEEPRYEEMSDEELRQCLEVALRTNKVLKLENDVFERYLSRHDPQSLANMAQVLETASHVQKVSSRLNTYPSVVSLSAVQSTTGSIMREKTTIFSPSMTSSQTLSGSRRYISALFPSASKIYRITLAHRIEMANKEIDEMKKSLAALERSTIKHRANLRARMEEIELRIRETREARDELEENIVKNGVDPMTGKIPAEKFIRFIDDWLKAADSVIDKLRLKTSTIKAQIKKTMHQLRQREELGETLHPVDFQQLAIENQDYMKQIEEKNQHLIDLKKVTARYNISLTTYKQKMMDQMALLNDIRKDLGTKKSQIEKLKINRDSTRLEVEKAEKQLEKILRVMDEYTVPDVLEFVKLQAELDEMKKTYKRLQRHRNVQTNALRTFKSQGNQHKRMMMKNDESRFIANDE